MLEHSLVKKTEWIESSTIWRLMFTLSRLLHSIISRDCQQLWFHRFCQST